MTEWDVHLKNEAGQDDAVRVGADTAWEAERIGYRESNAVEVVGAYEVGESVGEPVLHTHSAWANGSVGGGNWWESRQYDAHRGGPYPDADAACAVACAVAAGVAGGAGGAAGVAGGAAGDAAGDTDGDA